MILKGFPKRYENAAPIVGEKVGESVGDNWLTHYRQGLATVDSGGIVVMYGAHGTGKTRMAWEIARKSVPQDSHISVGGIGWNSSRKERPAIYTTAVGLFLEIRDTFRADSEFSEMQVVKKYTDAGLLVIDEFQERGETDFENKKITTIIDARYAHERPTILITNYTREKLASTLSPAVLDRIRENGCGLHFNWASYRKGVI